MSMAWSIRPARVPPRAAFGELLRTESLIVVRQRSGLIVGIGLPVILMLIFGSIPAFRKAETSLHGLTLLDVYLPVLVAMSMNNLGMFGLPPVLAGYREGGILRRLSTTPLPPSWVLGAQLVINFCEAVASIVIVLVLGVAVFNLRAPQNPGAFVLSVLLTIAALFSIGLWIAAVARTYKAANLISSAFFYPLLFFAGLWVPQPEMPAALRHVSDFTPLGASVQALQSAVEGPFPPASSLLVMAGYALVFGFVAVRTFKWE
ncbi:MAG: ABC transporter permease [Streptosporangiaceae bacterium]|nr:ABC transporter permease [Streptosporangiaceae bacterium]